MSEESNGFKLSNDLIVKLVTALVTALLGANLFSGVTSNKELTREQARWDSATAEIIIAKLDRIEARLETR